MKKIFPSFNDIFNSHIQKTADTLQEDELEQIISKGQLEKSKDEDEKLKQQSVTYTQYQDLADFGDDHLFKTDIESYLDKDLTARFEDPENWTG